MNEESQKGKPEEILPLFVQQPERPRWSDSGCRNWVFVAGGACIFLLMASLMIGVFMFKQTIAIALNRAHQRVVRGLPADLEPQYRVQLMKNLARFRDELRRASDPNPQIGGFLNRVNKAFEDGRLSVEEVAVINDYLESVHVDWESALPPGAQNPRNGLSDTTRRP
jgi:hypothetical protein